MLLDQLRFELRILGKWVFLTPIIFIVCLVILTEIMIFMHTSPLRISQVLTGSLEMLLPIAAGIIVTNFVSYDVRECCWRGELFQYSFPSQSAVIR